MGRSRPEINSGRHGFIPWRKFCMFYIYILLLKNNNLYTGFTTNLKNRYKQHIQGSVESTKYRRPLRLVHYECYMLETDARRREKFLKTSEGKLFLRRQLSVLFKKIGRYDEYKNHII